MKNTSRRGFLKVAGLTAASMATMNYLSSCVKTVKPNFVFFLADDLGWRDLGCYGSTFYETPNIDRLASEGMRFTDAYAACPVCSPTRASIMTGKYPARLDITDWIPGHDPKDRKLLGPQDLHQLPLGESTIAEALGKNGYKTFFAGKWHLGGQGYYPEDQGFEINRGGHDKGSPPGGYYSPYKNPKLTDGPEGEYLTDRLADESIRFVQNNADNPFLLFLSFYTVHTPIQACIRHLPKFQEKAENLAKIGPEQIEEHDGLTKQHQDSPDYASMIYALDENIGRILTKLEELQLIERTVVIFTSDNGGRSTLYRPGFPTSNLPLRAGKGWCYEGGIRVPLIIRASAISNPGSDCNIPVTSTDFYPTMLELASLRSIPEQHRDGISLVPLLRSTHGLNREAIFWHYPHYHGSAWTPGAAIRAGDWKLIKFYDKDKVELYNLTEDIGERTNLAEKMPNKRDELLNLLLQWQKDVNAKMPMPNPDYDPDCVMSYKGSPSG